MAKLVTDSTSLPERVMPIPGAKPPVPALPYKDLGHPEEGDQFRRLISDIRHRPDTRRR